MLKSRTLIISILTLFLLVLICGFFLSKPWGGHDFWLNFMTELLGVITTLFLVELVLLEIQDKKRKKSQELGSKRLKEVLSWFYSWLGVMSFMFTVPHPLETPRSISANATFAEKEKFIKDIIKQLEGKLPEAVKDSSLCQGYDWNKIFSENCGLLKTKLGEILDRYTFSFDATLVEKVEGLIDSSFIRTATMYVRHHDVAKELNYIEYPMLKEEIVDHLMLCLDLEKLLQD